MALTLQEYASYLDTRSDLSWPAVPEIERPRAKPSLTRLVGVRAVTWNIYGTLLALWGGQLYLEHPQKLMMDIALDKTIQEFKMWASMSRKPGQPADYLRQIYANLVLEQQAVPVAGEKFPEVSADRIWNSFIKKLFQKDYQFDALSMGSLNEFSRKVAYFFHASMQGTACYPGAAAALRHVKAQGLAQGILANTQCFSLIQLERGLVKQDLQAVASRLFDANLIVCSHELHSRLPSERIFRHILASASNKGIQPSEVLHIGSRIAQDVAPARRLGMKTGLFAGDKASLEATPEQLKDAYNRPDVLLTELTQIADVVG
ncbi:MAG TPA: HAD family hydrolase [Gemmataceae bacterium]|jgi:FMN phosphatase YigB (HAD superfamily)|nr:HAD family hydrolase [Gemmataceae bacterium]